MSVIRPLSKELQKKAELELNEVPSRIQDDIKHIRGWLKQQPHLNVVADDQWILTFLRGCKFSLQKTKEKLDMFYTMRTVLPELYRDRDPLLPEMQEILKLGLLLPLPKTSQPDGPRVIFNRCDTVDPWKIPFEPVVKSFLMIVDILLKEDDNFIIAGQHVLSNMKGMTVKHATGISPGICKKGVICLQDAYPTRPKGFHLINMPSFVEALFNLLKQLASEKNRTRIHVYTEETFKDIHKFISPSVLPNELGGEGGSFEQLADYWKKKVESYRDWFLEEANYCSEESKRPDKAKTADELFGMEGSFRKLEID